METIAALETTAFYVVGIALVVLALVTAGLGLRYQSFPGSRAALTAGIAIFVVFVAATAATAVINAREEQDERRDEQAAEEAEKQATEAEEEDESLEESEKQQQGGGGPGASTLDLSAPADGTLAFDTEALEAQAGEVTIRFDNSAAIEHDVVIEQQGEDIAKSDRISGDETAVSADLDPGKYVFYCSVPGHREGGMEGTLTVE